MSFPSCLRWSRPILLATLCVLMNSRASGAPDKPESSWDLSQPHRQLIDALLTSVDPVPALVGRVATGGRLNAGRALSRLVAAVVPAPSVAILRSADPMRFVIETTGVANTSYWIETTHDLGTWGGLVQVTTDASGHASIEISRSGELAQFWRVSSGVTAE